MSRKLTCPHCDYHLINPPLTEAEQAELERLSQVDVYRLDSSAYSLGEVDTSGEAWAEVRCPYCKETFYFNKRTGELSL